MKDKKETRLLKSLMLGAFVLTTASTLFADESSRQAREPRLRAGADKVLALVVDPQGPPAKPSESLHYLVTRESKKQGVIYAFSTPEARDRFVTGQVETRAEEQTGMSAKTTCPDARFNNTPGCTPSPWLVMACGQTNSYLSDSWNDRISCVEASGSWTILYKCYNFNRYPYNPNGSCSTLAIQGGTTYTDLNLYGFNNITSSIKVCPQGITFTECQNFF
jgi:hypothetical protein